MDKGFYYHFKHDQEKGINDHAYEVIGLGLHTEDGSVTVLYRPLYPSTFLGSADFLVRPYAMFVENITKNGQSVPRFQKIENPEIIEKLKKIIATMDGEGTKK